MCPPTPLSGVGPSYRGWPCRIALSCSSILSAYEGDTLLVQPRRVISRPCASTGRGGGSPGADNSQAPGCGTGRWRSSRGVIGVQGAPAAVPGWDVVVVKGVWTGESGRHSHPPAPVARRGAGELHRVGPSNPERCNGWGAGVAMRSCLLRLFPSWLILFCAGR